MTLNYCSCHSVCVSHASTRRSILLRQSKNKRTFGHTLSKMSISDIINVSKYICIHRDGALNWFFKKTGGKSIDSLLLLWLCCTRGSAILLLRLVLHSSVFSLDTVDLDPIADAVIIWSVLCSVQNSYWPSAPTELPFNTLSPVSLFFTASLYSNETLHRYPMGLRRRWVPFRIGFPRLPHASGLLVRDWNLHPDVVGSFVTTALRVRRDRNHRKPKSLPQSSRPKYHSFIHDLRKYFTDLFLFRSH